MAKKVIPVFPLKCYIFKSIGRHERGFVLIKLSSVVQHGPAYLDLLQVVTISHGKMHVAFHIRTKLTSMD